MTQESTAPRRDPVLIVVAGVLSLLLWLAVVIQYVFVVPRFERHFGEFQMRMPWFTQHIIHDSWWGVPAMIVVAILVCIGLGRTSRWPWLFLLILLPLIINVLVGVSLLFPYMQLLEALEAGGKQ